MRLWFKLFTLTLLSTTLGAATGCPGEDAECKDYTPSPSFDANAPVSLRADVRPIFAASCAFSTCHGSTIGDPNGVFLGAADGPALRRALVDVPSGQLPTMPFVKPGDPRNSYLLRKMDGSHCVLDPQCKGGSCGDPMPKGEGALPPGDRDKIRGWIAQGAQDN